MWLIKQAKIAKTWRQKISEQKIIWTSKSSSRFCSSTYKANTYTAERFYVQNVWTDLLSDWRFFCYHNDLEKKKNILKYKKSGTTFLS